MTRVVITFGLIASAIVTFFVFAARPFWKSGVITFENGALIGYTSMVIAMITIFFGIKSYRDNHLQGVISFGRATGVGMLIALVAAVGYSVGWEFYMNLFEPNFINEYADACLSKAKSEGVSEAEMVKLTASMDQMKEIYKIPVARFGMTMMEPLPVGILMTLFFAAILRKKEFLPATPAT